MIISAVLKGFAVGVGLIVAIGPQNTFIINQGIRRHHVLLTAIICSAIDVCLIALGVFGVGSLLALHPVFVSLAKWFGATFLTAYGLYSLYSAIQPEVLSDNSVEANLGTKKKTVLILLGLGFLNPHAYLDAVILLGSVAAQQAGSSKYLFGVGAMISSLIWFFVLGFGSKLLSPLFRKKIAWSILNVITGLLMLFVAYTIVAAAPA
ncbi:MAG: LysE/ArgO family amino acid transporter [Coxiellaceae bacterium]|nr:LysE/ArgO family amino acid transporter [Coxiellaceae bacterium]